MPKLLERKLKKQYGSKSDIPYKIMNAMEKKHMTKKAKIHKIVEKRMGSRNFA